MRIGRGSDLNWIRRLILREGTFVHLFLIMFVRKVKGGFKDGS